MASVFDKAESHTVVYWPDGTWLWAEEVTDSDLDGRSDDFSFIVVKDEDEAVVHEIVENLTWSN